MGGDQEASAVPDLWERLIAGQVTEVFTVSVRGLTVDLPQTLGLEVISHNAYVYDREGVARDAEELERIARELAAQPRWICNCGPLFWAWHFAEAAGAILVFPYGPGATLDFAEEAAGAWASDALKQAARAVLRRMRRGRGGEKVADDGLFAPSAFSVSRRSPQASIPQLVNLLVNEFPEKTFMLQSDDDLGALRSARALPRQR